MIKTKNEISRVCGLSSSLSLNQGLNIQSLNINIIPLVKRKDVSFILTIFPRISGTNDTSFESPNIGRLEFSKKLGMASS